MNAVEAMHLRADRVAQRELSKSEFRPCCKVRCSACCYEPAYAVRMEIERALEGMTPEQLDGLRARTEKWMEQARASRLLKDDVDVDELPDALEWRKHRIACPFLEGSLCSIYARRPVGCRMFFAKGDPADCEMPMREHQLFASFADHVMGEVAMPFFKEHRAAAMDVGHIGVLLHEVLQAKISG